ncbi:MAG: hypothetical protein P4L85_23655 [Paludisphaera borealis]|uniref:hypothetical protein n=1 Tax=Paludisphaera borealis TaxID=1387353 RepID=UPI00284F0CA9|nr:hypothetical protein [Paludisphaera borealis]MDR3622366.1 hypothetical protein [Paludisphaera borealis]
MSISRWSGNLYGRVWLLTAFWALLGAIGEARSYPFQGPPDQAAPPASAPSPAPAPAVVDDARPDDGRTPRLWPEQIIILDDVADIGEFWKKLAGPYILLKKAPPGSAKPGAPDAPQPTRSREYVVNSVKVEGTVEGARAHVVISIHFTVLVAGPIWVPIRLDDQVVLDATEGKKELELRPWPQNQKQWEARLEGEGEHQIRIELLKPVRIDAERRSLVLAIPEAPSTSFSLTLPQAVFDADLGTGETIGQKPLPGGKGVSLFARTKPRSLLTIGWSEENGASSRVAPLLAAQVEMAVAVDSEAVTTRSKWVIRCVRGVSRSLQIRLDDEEVVSRLQLNDQFPASGIEQAKGVNLLSIPLSEPMRQGDSRSLVLETRRPLSAGTGKTLIFSGYLLTNASEQSGMIGIAAQSPNLWVNLVNTQGLRRIDPRDLPTALLAQAGTSIALQFLDQPFRLELGVEDAPPLFSAESTTKLTLDADQVRNETTIDVKRVRGKLFEIEIGLAPELKDVVTSPAELIESTTPLAQEHGAGASPAQAERILKLRLTALGRDQKSLSLKLVGRQEAPNSGEARLGLFTPRGAVSTSATFSLYTGRDLTIETLDETLFNDVLRDPSTPDGKLEARISNVFGGGSPPPSLRLRSIRNPSVLKVRLQRHPLAITHENRVSATVARREVVVSQESAVQVRYGVIRSLTVRVPANVSSRWEASIKKEAVPRQDLGATKDGARRFRLTFDRPIVDASTLVFLYRVPLGRSLDPAAPTPIQIPWIQIEEGTAGGSAFNLTSDPNVKLAMNDPSWTRAEDDDPDRPETAGNLRCRLIPGAAAPNGLKISAELVESVSLPRLIVSRALVAATLGFDDDLRIHAWYALDAHSTSLALALPEGARWIRARVDGRTVEEIEADDDGLSYRFSLPPDSAGRPVVVEVEYQYAAKAVRKPWEPPKLLDGADVLQSYWLVQIPWNTALVGLPGGWADENRWYWDLYVWKRRPVATIDKLIAWVSESTAAANANANAIDEIFADRDDSHGYLFGRAGPPSALNAWVVSRAWIIVVCSGLVLALGFATTFPRVGERWVWGFATVAGLLSAMFLHPSTIALFLQSASCGFLLTFFGYVIHRMLRRDGDVPPAVRPGISAGSGVGYDSSQRSATGVGSDDSTAVRVRVSSTMDYLSLPPTPEPELETSRSSPLSGNPANP